MADQLLISYLEKTLASIRKDAISAEERSKKELGIHTPFAQWTNREQERFLSVSSEERCTRSFVWQDKQVALEASAHHLENIIFNVKNGW